MTERVLGPSGSKRRKTRLLIITALLGTVFAVLFVTASTATLSGGSTFESGDGDLAPNTSTPPAPHDWNAPVEPIACPSTIPGAGTNCGLDLVKDQTDNSLGQGAKEDDPAPTVVSGQIPPSKDDLSRFYVNKERAGGNDYLYLAWERSNLLGSAHMDFEFNQDSTLSANGVTPVRTAGDLLIDFDFGGSGVPVLQKHTWITTGNAATDCEASNTLPCWDKAVTLGSSAEAQVNSAPVTDTNPPGAPRTLDGNTKNGINSTFGEAGINLTASGIFSPGVCKHFGSAYLKSRSSGNSFSSELKDFIAPIAVNISNCGTLIVKKVTIPSPDPTDTSFSFTVNGANPPNTILPKTFGLKNGGSESTTVFAGTFSAAESVPTGWTLVAASTSCDNNSGTLSGSTISGISVGADEVVTCTFTNQLQRGAIKITKTSTKGNTPLAGATFEIKNSGGTVVGTPTSGADGTACVDNLPLGTYGVKETATPTGYKIDDATSHSVSITQAGTCTTGVQATTSFTDTPLSEIEVKFTSLAGSGVTKASIVCANGGTVAAVSENGNADPALDDTDETFTSLTPGTYTCTVVVDP